MLWIGIGILIIGLALLILSIVLIKPLFKLAGVLGSVQKTTDALPQHLGDLTSQATNAITTGTDTLHKVNSQIEKLTPLFTMVGDVGRATNKLSSSISKKVNKVDGTMEDRPSVTLEGFYGLIALIYLLFKKK